MREHIQEMYGMTLSNGTLNAITDMYDSGVKDTS